MRTFRAVLIPCLLVAAAGAQSTLVIPAGMNAAEGDSSNAFPWGRGGAGIRVQFVYDSSHFTSQGVNTPIAITRLRWRPNGNTSSPASSQQPGIGSTVWMSTCPVDQSAVTTSFAGNRGADYTQVFQGVVAWPAAAATPGPSPFLIDVPLQAPFLYDPRNGDLNIETDIPVQTYTGTALQLDVQATNPLASRVYLTTNYPAGVPVVNTSHGVVVEVTYQPAANYATAVPFGTGCVARNTSLYELFATSAAFDLANSSVSFVGNGGGYTVLPGIGTFVPPSASASSLTLADDSEALVTLTGSFPYPGGATTQLAVCSNGYVSVATGNGTAYTPAPATMLNAPQTGWWNWHDYNPSLAGSGAVKFEEIGNVAYITWDGVWDFGGTSSANANTFQFQFDKATGLVHMVFQTLSALGNARLVGYSPGGTSSDPGSTDLSVALPAGIALGTLDTLPLLLTAATRPISGTNCNLVTSNIPAGSPFGALMLGIQQFNPGIDLTTFGMAGCFQYTDASTTRLFVGPGASQTTAIALPNGFAGVHFGVQSAVFCPQAGLTLLGGITSNGIHLGVDNN